MKTGPFWKREKIQSLYGGSKPRWSESSSQGSKHDTEVSLPSALLLSTARWQPGVTPAKANVTQSSLKGRKQARVPESFRSQHSPRRPCNPAPAPQAQQRLGSQGRGWQQASPLLEIWPPNEGLVRWHFPNRHHTSFCLMYLLSDFPLI